MRYAAFVTGFAIGSVVAQTAAHHHYRVAGALLFLAFLGWVCGYCSAELGRRTGR